MSYEIPNNLKYSEKIFFNLSFEQAAWFGLFGFIIFVLYTKTPVMFEAKIVISIILACLGIGFAFFGLRKHLIRALKFAKNKRETGYLDKRTGKFIQIQKIEDDSAFINSTPKAILQVQPINFHILSTRQQKAIIEAYKDFLNSLDFPIQIIIRTVNLDLDQYLDKLEQTVKKRNKEQRTNRSTIQRMVKHIKQIRNGIRLELLN